MSTQKQLIEAALDQQHGGTCDGGETSTDCRADQRAARVTARSASRLGTRRTGSARLRRAARSGAGGRRRGGFILARHIRRDRVVVDEDEVGALEETAVTTIEFDSARCTGKR